MEVDLCGVVGVMGWYYVFDDYYVFVGGGVLVEVDDFFE